MDSYNINCHVTTGSAHKPPEPIKLNHLLAGIKRGESYRFKKVTMAGDFFIEIIKYTS